jgi:hypothetical protein
MTSPALSPAMDARDGASIIQLRRHLNAEKMAGTIEIRQCPLGTDPMWVVTTSKLAPVSKQPMSVTGGEALVCAENERQETDQRHEESFW